MTEWINGWTRTRLLKEMWSIDHRIPCLSSLFTFCPVLWRHVVHRPQQKLSDKCYVFIIMMFISATFILVNYCIYLKWKKKKIYIYIDSLGVLNSVEMVFPHIRIQTHLDSNIKANWINNRTRKPKKSWSGHNCMVTSHQKEMQIHGMLQFNTITIRVRLYDINI